MRSYTFQLGPRNKALVLLFTLVACIALAFYAGFIARTAIVYTHFFYIPILLAGVWYHKKAVYVALGLGVVHILVTLISPLPLTVNEGARAAIFVAVAYVVGFSSERAEEERRLRESAEKTARIVDSSPVPTFVMDSAHKITHWNAAIEALTGINREEVMGTDKQWTPFYPAKRPVMADLIIDERPERELEELYGGNSRQSPLIPGAYEALAFFPALGEHGKWLRFTAAPLRGPGGDIVGAIETLLDITERMQAEKALQERVKELNCLYGLSKLMETPGISLDEILQDSVDLIPPALRYPEISCARITLDDQEFKTANFQETTWKQSSAITLRGERIGTLDACNLEERPPSDAGPFLKEEISLLDALTERLGKIVDRKRMEEALRESEVRYRTLFEGAAEGVLGADVETKQFKYANPAICKMLGYTEEELKSMGVSDIHPQEDLEWVISEFEAQARSEKTLASALPCLRKDGTVIYVDVNTSPIVVDGRESNVGFFADITDRKQAEEALLESESKYKTLVENIPQKIFLKDKNSVYISCNENYARDLKIKCNEIVGKTDYDFYPKELADKYRANDKRVIESDKEQELEEKYITDGREVWVNTIKTPVKDKNGNVIGVLGIFWDITERKQVEEERELLIKDLEVKHAEMERFAYTISHELKTPLITLRGYTDLLQRDLEQRASEKVATDLSFIDSAADMMARLLEDTLELSRTGRVMNPPEDVPFSALVRDALVQLTEQLKWGRIDVAVAEDLPTVRVDRLRVVEVLVNLMENSIKFMGDQPRPRIEIGSRKEGDEVVFFVKDNGIGLDKSQHEKVFQLFYKVDKESKGSGAGLAIVKRIAEVHGGRIWIESELGKGCTVCFTLPVV